MGNKQRGIDQISLSRLPESKRTEDFWIMIEETTAKHTLYKT